GNHRIDPETLRVRAVVQRRIASVECRRPIEPAEPKDRGAIRRKGYRLRRATPEPHQGELVGDVMFGGELTIPWRRCKAIGTDLDPDDAKLLDDALSPRLAVDDVSAVVQVPHDVEAWCLGERHVP